MEKSKNRLTDKAVPAELERIDPAYARSFPHSSLPQKQLYRRLAELHAGMGEIVANKHVDDCNLLYYGGCGCAEKLARKHLKEGTS